MKNMALRGDKDLGESDLVPLLFCQALRAFHWQFQFGFIKIGYISESCGGGRGKERAERIWVKGRGETCQDTFAYIRGHSRLHNDINVVVPGLEKAANNRGTSSCEEGKESIRWFVRDAIVASTS